MIKAVLFDIDGTLLDTTEFIYQAFEHTIKKFGLPNTSRETLSKLIGKPLEDCYAAIISSDETTHLVEAHRLYQEKNLHLSIPFPDTVTTLQHLKEQHIQLVAISTRSKRTSLATLELAGIVSFFDLVISREDISKQKPDPEGIQKALKFLMLKPKEAMMVGDTDVDVNAGKNAGVQTIGATYGFHKEKVTESNPDYVIHSIKEILPILASA
jgi:pyrophosphatase PpaX